MLKVLVWLGGGGGLTTEYRSSLRSALAGSAGGHGGGPPGRAGVDRQLADGETGNTSIPHF